MLRSSMHECSSLNDQSHDIVYEPYSLNLSSMHKKVLDKSITCR
jgi:hypothetical protein